VDLTLSTEQTLIRDTARDLANKEIAPRAAEIDKQHRFPREIVTRLGEIGLLLCLDRGQHVGQ
jgi:alkylation response protein AidB-like acyl-CoA dehydrogenase